MPPKNPVWALTLIILLIFTAYSFVLSADYKTLDDQASIVNNTSIKSFANLNQIFSTAFFGDRSYYRPLVALSFMTEYYFFGLNPSFYYLTNILLHCATTIVVFLLAGLILKNAGLALIVALLFGIHPIQWEAVANIPGRSILLCAFFYLNAFYFFLLFWQRRRRVFYLLSLTLFGLALLCKESAIVLPFVIGPYLWLFERRPGEKIRFYFAPMIPFVVVIAGYLWVRHSLGITEIFYWPTVRDAFLGFLSFLRGVITYGRLMIMPVDLYFDRAQRVLVSFLEPEAVMTFVFFAAGLWIMWNFRRRLGPLILFSIFWFFLELAPVSQLIATIGVQAGYISIAEHFLYIACIPAFIVLVLGFRRLGAFLLERKILEPRTLTALTVGILIFLFAMTTVNTIYAVSELSMLKRATAINPKNFRLLFSLGNIYAKERNFEEAEKVFRTILATEPSNYKARIALGKALCDQGKYLEGIAEYDQVSEAGNFKELLEENLRLTYAIVIREYEAKIKENPQDAKAHNVLGLVYGRQGRMDDSLAMFKRADELDPKNKGTLFNLASLYESRQEFPEAIGSFERMLALDASDDDLGKHARRHLSQMYEHLGDHEKAQYYSQP